MKLDEIRKDFLYHNTDLYSLIEMFRDGHLGKPGRSTSLTRDRHYDNAPGSGVVGREVRLVFDRDELKNRYKLKPYADLSVTKDRFGDTTVKGHEARWESEERVRGPISLNDVLRIEISPKAAKKLAQITKGHQEAIQHGKKRIEMLSKGYFWHNPRQEFVKIETERQKKRHVGSEPQIEKSIEDSRERIKLYKDIVDSVVIVSEFNEEAAGVGKITKQNTTVDVKPGETQRQAAKFGNKVDKNGKPPELHKKARKNSNTHILTNLGMAESKNTISGKRMLKMFQGMHHEAGGNKEMDQFILNHDWQAGYLSPDMIPDYEELFDYDDPFGRIIDVDLEHHVNTDEPVIVGPQYSDGKYSIIDGNHRAFIAAEQGKGVPAFFPVKSVTESASVSVFANELENRYGLKSLFLSDLKNRNAIEVSNIIVDREKQKQGTGTAVMQEIVKFADQHGRILVLDPAIIDKKHGTTSQSRLRRFYKRFGFIENKGRNKNYEFRQLMIRYPQSQMNEVEIDNVNGRGSVPNNQNVNYLGKKVMMRPSMFLKLAAPLDRDARDEMKDFIRQGGAIGAPFLIIDVPEDLSKDIPHIKGHEGRNRMKAVLDVEGDAPIEVHLFFRGAINRARHLTDEIVKFLKAGAYQEITGRHVPGPLWEAGQQAYGYKAMKYDPDTGEIHSGADSRVTKGVKLRKGMTLKMPGKGIFMSTNREYVEQYYSGHNDYEALIKFEFNPDEITSGNLTDRENEFTVPRARVIDFEILNHIDESIKRIKRDKKTKFGVQINQYEPEGKKIAMMGPFEIWMTDAHSDYNTPAAQIWDPVNNKMAGFIALGGKEGDEYAKYETGVLADNTYVTGTAVVHDHYAGMGLVTRGYITLLQNGFVLVSDQLQTAGGEKIWRKLATTPGINVYAARISQKDNEVTYSAVDPDDIEDSNYKVYRDEETAEIHGEIGRIQVKRDLLAHRVKKMKEKIDAGYKVDMAKYEDAADQVAVMDRELEMLMREYERSAADDSNSHKVRLMAVADNINVTESTTESEQRIPVSQNYNQDRGNLDWIVIQIEKTIKELGDNLDVLVKTVNWDQLYATQDWLDNHGGGDPVFPGIPEDFWGYPVIASTGREFLIIDGHHRLNRDLADGEEAEGLVFDVRSTTRESEIRKPHPSQTLGIKRKHMPQVHRDHYPELIDYLADHGNRFTHGEVHAHELKATQGEFSDKGVRKMMKTGGRPSDSMGKDKKPLIVSSDNYIIDGHHRWLAAWNQDDVVPIMKSSLPIKQLFQLIKDFRHTTYKDIHDSYTPLEVAIMEGGHSLEDLAESRIMGVPIDRNYIPDEFDDVEISRKKLIGKINDKFNLWFGKSKYPQKDGEYLLIVEDENKNRIGMAMLYLAKNDIPEYDMKNLYSVALVYIDSSYANQNIGLEMYAAAINSGISLLSDYQQTLGGQKLWKRLSQYPGVEVYATAIYSDYDTDESRVVISDIDYDEFGNIDSSFFVYDDDYTDEEIKLHNQLSQAQKMLKSLKSKGGKKSADRQDQIVTLEREIQAIMDELNTFNDEDESYSDVRLMATRSNSIKENISITGTERQRSERDKKLTPGSEAWFRHWFSRPFLRREQVEQLKQEAVNHIKGARHEKATNRRRSDRNIRTNERRGTRRC